MRGEERRVQQEGSKERSTRKELEDERRRLTQEDGRKQR